MSLQQTIVADLKTALKQRNRIKTDAIRVLIGEFQRQPEKELTDEQVAGIIKKLIKSEKELLAASGRKDSGFIEVIEAYLPKQASEDEIRSWISENVDFSRFTNKMQAMKPVMAHFAGKADGNTVKKILQTFNG